MSSCRGKLWPACRSAGSPWEALHFWAACWPADCMRCTACSAGPECSREETVRLAAEAAKSLDTVVRAIDRALDVEFDDLARLDAQEIRGIPGIIADRLGYDPN